MEACARKWDASASDMVAEGEALVCVPMTVNVVTFAGCAEVAKIWPEMIFAPKIGLLSETCRLRKNYCRRLITFFHFPDGHFFAQSVYLFY